MRWTYQRILTVYISYLSTKKWRIKRWKSKRRRTKAKANWWLRERESGKKTGENCKRNCDFRVFIIKIKTLMAGNREHETRFTRKWITIADRESVSLDVHLPGKRSCFPVLWQFQIESLFFFPSYLSFLKKKKNKNKKKKKGKERNIW